MSVARPALLPLIFIEKAIARFGYVRAMAFDLEKIIPLQNVFSVYPFGSVFSFQQPYFFFFKTNWQYNRYKCYTAKNSVLFTCQTFSRLLFSSSTLASTFFLLSGYTNHKNRATTKKQMAGISVEVVYRPLITDAVYTLASWSYPIMDSAQPPAPPASAWPSFLAKEYTA